MEEKKAGDRWGKLMEAQPVDPGSQCVLRVIKGRIKHTF